MNISKEVKVGLFTVIALVLLYLGLNYLKGIDFLSSRNKYYAVYENVDKLAPSNQIYVNGYSVGRVSKIQYQQAIDRVLVEMEIDDDLVLNEESVAILNGDILGTKFIQLNIGHSPKTLNPKDTIKAEVARGIQDFLEENAAPVASNLSTTLGKFNNLLDSLKGNSQKLNGLILEWQRTGHSVNTTVLSANEKIGMIADQLKTVSTGLNTALSELKPTLSNFHAFSDSLKRLELGAAVGKVQQSLNKLNETLGKLNSGDNTMSKLLTEDSLYVNLNRVLQSIDTLATHLNENPKHFFGPLGQNRRKIERDLEKQRKEEEK
jgi:phospholipid/cholesterol/gamma-HCH transport system substrate-binding protein